MNPLKILALLPIIFLVVLLSQKKAVNPVGQTVKTVITGTDTNIPFKLASGYSIRVFANNLLSPRVLVFSPGGTLLVSDIGSNQVIAIPDNQNKKVVINSGNHIHGLAFFDDKLFAAHVDKVVRYNWDEKNLTATYDKDLFSLPQNNNHNNRTITFDNAGNLYVSVGSTCNVCNELDPRSGSVLISNADGENPRVFASGLRNAAFIQVNPQTSELWGTEMGRDLLGDDLPPDEINIIKQGSDYGWPYCYGEKEHDNSFDPANTHSCNDTVAPIYQIPSHSAPLGLVFWQGDLFVAYHGSWNRSVPTGYKIVRMKVEGNRITKAEDFLTGFMQNGDTLGRPAGLVFDKTGNLYISDDKGGNIFIVRKNNG